MKINKKLFLFFLGINLLIIVYLLLPLPALPYLPNSTKSTLPGDSYEIPNVDAYFTNSSRTDVMNFYYQIYRNPFYIRLNHPPEKSKAVIINTIQSTYLEELVIPFKQSLFISGYEWANDVFTPVDKRAGFKLYVGTQLFNAKVTTRTFSASFVKSFISILFVELSFFYIIFAIKSTLFKKHS